MLKDKDLIRKIDISKDKEKTLLQILLLMLSVLLIFLNLETIYAYDPNDWFSVFGFIVYKYNEIAIISIILIMILCYALIGNAVVVYGLLSVLSIVFGVANRAFIDARGEFLTVREIVNFREAMGLEGSHLRILNPYLITLIILNIILGFAVVKAGYINLNRCVNKRNLLCRGMTAVIVTTAYYLIFTSALRDSYIDMLLNNTTGSFITLNESIFEMYYSNMAYEKVEGIKASYNNEAIEKNEYNDADNVEVKPDIIVVMSEAFWDTNDFVDNIRIEPDPMQTFYDLANNALTGKCAVDVFGGGTNVSEWEFNTGCSNGNPYGVLRNWRDFEKNRYETFVTYLEKQGYVSMALHGYDASFYNRNMVYPNMGFDEFYDYNDFNNKDMYNGYISDESLTKEIIYRYEEEKNNEDAPVYLFAISIQNHVENMDHKTDDSNDNVRYVSVDYENIEMDDEYKRKLLKYVNGIYLSNKALKELIDYFSECKDETMIVFFGDHAPNFLGLENNIYDENLKYRTPYLIWTNYDNDYSSPGDINLSYLPAQIVGYLNMPDTLLTRKNRYLSAKYGINTIFERASDNLNEAGKEEYMEDMLNERIIYSYEEEADPAKAYLW